MQPLDDYPIGPERERLEPPRDDEGSGRRWVIAALAALVAGAVAAFFYMRQPEEQAAPASAAAPAAAPATAPAPRSALGPDVEPRELPPLDLSDPVVRELLGALSSRPELAAWLASDGLIRNLAVSLDNVARGQTPSTHLRRIAPKEPFAAQARGEAFVVDPRGFRRYNGLADTVASLDADGVARAYVTLRPRLQEAYDELGTPGKVDDVVERALARLLATPVLERDLEVRPSPVLYKYSDERIERLLPVQKQMLRMGPRNVRLIQDKLRELAAALGIPPERLASP